MTTIPLSTMLTHVRKYLRHSFNWLESRSGVSLPEHLELDIVNTLEEELVSSYPRDVKAEVLCSLEQELGAINRKKSPGRVAEEFNKIFKKEFERRRKSQYGGYHSIPVQFDGEYIVNPRDTSYSKLYANDGGYGCPFIPIDPEHSIIARALVTGRDQHVPDTSKDPSHWACEEGTFNEEVYPIFSKPLSKGPLTGYRIAVGVFDFDFKKPYTLTKREAEELGRIVRPYGELIFPGEPRFEYKAQGEIYIMSPQEAEARNRELKIDIAAA